jgi:hypothetical protein
MWNLLPFQFKWQKVHEDTSMTIYSYENLTRFQRVQWLLSIIREYETNSTDSQTLIDEWEVDPKHIK